MNIRGRPDETWRKRSAHLAAKNKTNEKNFKRIKKGKKLSSLVRTVFTRGGAVRYLSSVESNDVLLGEPALDIFLCALFCQKGLLEMYRKRGRMKRTGGTVRKWEQTATLRITVNS